MQREHADSFALRQQLAGAREAADAATRRADALAAGLADAQAHGTVSDRGLEAQLQAARAEAAQAAAERDALRWDCDQKEAELMELQGQLKMARGMANDVENWLMAP